MQKQQHYFHKVNFLQRKKEIKRGNNNNNINNEPKRALLRGEKSLRWALHMAKLRVDFAATPWFCSNHVTYDVCLQQILNANINANANVINTIIRIIMIILWELRNATIEVATPFCWSQIKLAQCKILTKKIHAYYYNGKRKRKPKRKRFFNSNCNWNCNNDAKVFSLIHSKILALVAQCKYNCCLQQQQQHQTPDIHST